MIDLPTECVIYIDKDGSVVFADLVDSMQPVADALDPSTYNTKGKTNVALYANQDQDC